MKNQNGFSAIEVLVALTLVGLLITFLSSKDPLYKRIDKKFKKNKADKTKFMQSCQEDKKYYECVNLFKKE